MNTNAPCTSELGEAAVLMQKMRNVGVLQPAQKPRLAHNELERLAVDVQAFDDAGARDGVRSAASCGSFEVGDAEGSAERTLCME